MSLAAWENFFKPETRSSGQVYFRKGVVTSSQPSDTEVQAYIRGASTFKITLKSSDVGSPLINAACNCPAGKKRILCKHIWAALLKAEQSHPGFLDEKTDIEVSEPTSLLVANKNVFQKPTFTPRPPSQAQLDSQAAYKAKQADYRKEQYQKQKQRLKDQKQSKKSKKAVVADAFEFPADVQTAVTFFSMNGFLMEHPLNATVIGMAKKRLSRVFHPDVGGSHDEIIELNKNYEILIKFAKEPEAK
ncbi:MAG: SWIM zinc finger family protein [Bdellovibrio sp.]|nr:SWIM zinc finger family protein [Bdellovibrio sp.]